MSKFLELTVMKKCNDGAYTKTNRKVMINMEHVKFFHSVENLDVNEKKESITRVVFMDGNPPKGDLGVMFFQESYETILEFVRKVNGDN